MMIDTCRVSQIDYGRTDLARNRFDELVSDSCLLAQNRLAGSVDPAPYALNSKQKHLTG